MQKLANPCPADAPFAPVIFYMKEDLSHLSASARRVYRKIYAAMQCQGHRVN